MSYCKSTRPTMSRTIILLLMTLSCLGCASSCKTSVMQYKHNGMCCTRCDPGTKVKAHCGPNRGSTCEPCDSGTFFSQRNSDTKCQNCSQCLREMGLYTVQDCMSTSDTVCDCLEGYHCLNMTEKGCSRCEKHTACQPGYFIKRPGTYRKDTWCEECPNNQCPPEVCGCNVHSMPWIIMGSLICFAIAIAAGVILCLKGQAKKSKKALQHNEQLSASTVKQDSLVTVVTYNDTPTRQMGQ
ncbi:tumor necrosis factor receptor superfamily member 14-like [Acipenser ruthenus]|uniref:tumor necrosis factor receptor superfamily member 14-like n=1 Tax=Acipenser ruthenus TaxID=7906 RepID=UPI00145BD829|nr:tumor necrosis factor receptor superfamily member 14-like [Acipenser ruthenus]XP_058867599.1 tumor necrosis factor receptor superfamily member 14-like [Acipenser ruthenus]